MSYEKQTFEDKKTVLTAKHLNHIEDGIEQVTNQVEKSKIVTILGDDGILSFQLDTSSK
jgi:hypothetical protein